MPAPGTHPGLPRRVDAPDGAPVRRDAALPGDGPAEGRRPAGERTSRARSAASEIANTPARAPRSLGGFLRETRAAVGLTAAAVAIMLLGGVALIGDHLWMVGKRDLLQRAADAAVVASTFELRRRPGSESDAQVEAALRPVAERYARFNVLGNTSGELKPEEIEVALDVDRAAGMVGVSVKADVADTLFAKLLYGYEGPGEVTTRAGAERDTTRTEVALAIDVTTSMDTNLAGGWSRSGELSRMAIVRRAAHVLIDILDPGDKESMIAIGVVPWHINVRLNETMRTAWEHSGWAVYPTEKTYPLPYSSRPSSPPAETWPMPPKTEDWRGCLDQRALTGRRPPGLGAALPSRAPFTMAFFPVARSTSYQCRDLSGDSFDRFWQSCYHGPTSGEFAQEEVGSRYCPDPSSGSSRCTSRPEEEIPCPGSIPSCSQVRVAPQQMCEDGWFVPILPLTRDMAVVRRTVDALEPTGNMTYSTMGLIWGRRLLTPEWRPVWGGEVHPVDPDDEGSLGVRKAIVLLTDGEDNYDSALGAAPDRSAACTAAKRAGIEVFVVAAMNPDEIGSGLSRGLTDCSSQGDFPDRTYVFLENHSREDLEDAFRQIAHQLLVVRRTH